MFCVERVQRAMTAMVLIVVMGLLAKGFFVAANIILGFVILMMTIWALFDFCPAVFILSKILPHCECPKDKKAKNE